MKEERDLALDELIAFVREGERNRPGEGVGRLLRLTFYIAVKAMREEGMSFDAARQQYLKSLRAYTQAETGEPSYEEEGEDELEEGWVASAEDMESRDEENERLLDGCSGELQGTHSHGGIVGEVQQTSQGCFGGYAPATSKPWCP